MGGSSGQKTPTNNPGNDMKPISESKVEEIIACLWSLMWVILWVNHAPNWMLVAVGVKAASDHLCAIIWAIQEICSEKPKKEAQS